MKLKDAHIPAPNLYVNAEFTPLAAVETIAPAPTATPMFS